MSSRRTHSAILLSLSRAMYWRCKLHCRTRFTLVMPQVFIAPVLSPTDNPQSYFELDSSPTGVMWAGLSNNSLGNSSVCVSADGCAHPGTLPCTGTASFPHGLTVSVENVTSEGWSTSVYIPWALFSTRFQPIKSSSGLQPWGFWRANFYRYDYPNGPQGIIND